MTRTTILPRLTPVCTPAARFLARTVIILSPWLFGCSDPWAYKATSILSFTALICYLMGNLRARQPQRIPALTFIALGLILTLSIQVVPLPPEWLQLLSPLSFDAQQAATSVMTKTDLSTLIPHTPTGRMTLSMTPDSTHYSILLFASYVSLFFVLLNTHTLSVHRRNTLFALLVSGFLLALIGLAQKLSGTHDIYWNFHPRYGGNIFGSFSNRNHYAAWMNMILAASLGLLLRQSLKRSSATEPRDFGLNQTIIIMLVIMATSVILTASRAGIICLLLILGLITLARSRSRITSKNRSALTAIIFLSLATVTWLGWEPIVARFETLAQTLQDPGADTRAIATTSTLEIFLRSPFIGTGPGSFQHVFPSFQPESIQFGRFLHAHNDWAQLLSELGLIGLVAVLLVLTIVTRRVIQSLKELPLHERLLMAGLATALVSLLVHSGFDYSLHKPAVAYTFSALLALILATSFNTGGEKESSAPISGFSHTVAPLVIAALAITLIIATARTVPADLAAVRFFNFQTHSTSDPSPQHAKRYASLALSETDAILAQNPTHADTLLDLSYLCLQNSASPTLPSDVRAAMMLQALRAATLAAHAAPSNYSAWLLMSHAQFAMGLEPEALICYEQAKRLQPPNAHLPRPSALEDLRLQRQQ